MTEAQQRQLHRVVDAMIEYDRGDPMRIHHFLKVHAFARQIGEAEGLDGDAGFILETAAILHDIGIHPAETLYGSSAGPLQERLGPPEAEKILRALDFDEEVTARVSFLIGHHHTTVGVDAKDWRILLEADFLVNMIEERISSSAIDHARDTLFETEEGLRLLSWVRPGA